jgi:UDP-N-acetylmuramate: L-alanyl-gamma-D-glutamyl-meso-diaminopimelate ligase
MHEESSQAKSLDIYLIAIGGTGMAPLACLLSELGHRVRGSDGPLYPPMSTLLEQAGIQPIEGYDSANLMPSPDLVVVGNAVRRDHVEALFVESTGIERISMPQAVARFLLPDRRSLVAAGTHGKTTTSSMAAWVYTRCGADPGYLIGGVPLDLDGSFRLGSGERFVIEGDEYNAAYFDRGPKFLHYQAQTVLLTSVEYDHADLYPDEESFVAAFRALIASLPEDGHLVACGDHDAVRELVENAPCRVTLYGVEQRTAPEGPLDLGLAAPLEARETGTVMTVVDPEAGVVEIELQVWGAHNASNALAVYAAARADGYSADQVAAALGSFRGVRRRLEERGRPAGVIVVDDFAHHPTEARSSLGGLRGRYGDRRLIVCFEPRSLTAGRSFLRDQYQTAFDQADVVLIAPVFYRQRFEARELVDFEGLALDLRTRGIEAHACASVDEVFERAIGAARPGDVVATMSSGSFENLPSRLLDALSDSETVDSENR